MSASKKPRSAADFLPVAAPAVEPVAETATVAEILAEQAAPAPTEASGDADALEPGTGVVGDSATVAALMAELQSMRKELGDLRKSQNRIIEETSDLTDNLWFIARPNGKKDLRTAIVRTANGKNARISVEDIRTSFVGPFNTQEDVRTYLAAKALKRSDSVIDWSTCLVMEGRDARNIEIREEKQFQQAYGNNPDAQANVLEKRVRPMFDRAAAEQKALMGGAKKGEGIATGQVALPSVFVKKLADGTETLDIRNPA